MPTRLLATTLRGVYPSASRRLCTRAYLDTTSEIELCAKMRMHKAQSTAWTVLDCLANRASARPWLWAVLLMNAAPRPRKRSQWLEVAHVCVRGGLKTKKCKLQF
jgi:hypothetical protein